MCHLSVYVSTDLAFYFFGQLKQPIGAETPVGFDASRKTARRICIYSYGVDAHLHTLNEGRSCTAERIEHKLARLRSKSD